MSNRKRNAARVYLHPTATHSPAAVRKAEKSTGRKAVIANGTPILVAAADARKFLRTGA